MGSSDKGRRMESQVRARETMIRVYPETGLLITVLEMKAGSSHLL